MNKRYKFIFKNRKAVPEGTTNQITNTTIISVPSRTVIVKEGVLHVIQGRNNMSV